MDTTIVAAIIGAVAVVLSAFIGVLSQKRKVTKKTLQFQKSKALKLGYIIAAIQLYTDAKEMAIVSGTIDTTKAIQQTRAHEIAQSIGISINLDASEWITNLALKFDGKPLPVRSAFKIGNVIGRIYFYAISFMATGSLPPIETDIDRLGEAEVMLRQADLSPKFLNPVRDLWKDTLASVRKGNNHPIDKEMEDVIDQLCSSIEIDK
jgi:hypothetical protein